MLTLDCKPIVISAAGLRSPWFLAVEALGWHWVGRSRNRDLVRTHADTDDTDDTDCSHAPGIGCKTLYAQANSSALACAGHLCDLRATHADRAGVPRCS
jgi:hypothetical protein